MLLGGCLTPQVARQASIPATLTATATQTSLPSTLTATQTPTLTPIPSLTPTPEPLGCQKPPEDYTRVEVNGETLNQRTLAMLTHAQELYGGEIELTGYAITQGSYTTPWSFLWHALRWRRGRSLGHASRDLYCPLG